MGSPKAQGLRRRAEVGLGSCNCRLLVLAVQFLFRFLGFRVKKSRLGLVGFRAEGSGSADARVGFYGLGLGSVPRAPSEGRA